MNRNGKEGKPKMRKRRDKGGRRKVRKKERY